MASMYPGTLKGHFLIAMPGLLDPNFLQTVTCICEHTDQGAMGIVINRIVESLRAKTIFDQLAIPCSRNAEDIPLYMGGPVHGGELFVLHGPPFTWEATLQVTASLGLLLKQAGYATAAFVAAFPVHSRFGLSSGFDVYDDRFGDGFGPTDLAMPERPASTVVPLAREWMEIYSISPI